MKVWVKTDDYSEGKFLVVRRDGTIVEWPHFVLGARDPAVPPTLEDYACNAKALGMEEEYCSSVESLAADFESYRHEHGKGDPEAGPHRKDDARIIAAMRNGGHISDYF